MDAAADTKPVATQVSAPIRIVALIGGLVALAMGAWLMTAGRGGSTESADAVVPLQAVQRADAVASKLTARNVATASGKTGTPAPATAAAASATAAATPKTSATKTAAAKPVAAKHAKAAPAATPAKAATKQTPTLAAGAPRTIAGLLATHPVVVVLLYDTNSKVDEYSLSEAVLGAKNAGAGFLRVDVRNQKQALPFTNAYGVLQDPSVLVFKRPGALAVKLSGFADHETVAQAATNARGVKTTAR